VGARLARAGCDVLFLVRRPEAARAIERDGVTLEDPASGERFSARVAAAVWEAAGPSLAGRSVLLCTRTTDTETAGRALARLAPGAASPEDLVRRSFAFLLRREPKESILRRFDLPLIGRYFPEWEAEIGQG
jgi:hypothetical protein